MGIRLVRFSAFAGVLIFLQAAEAIYLFVDLALAEKLADCFNSAGLDGREAVEFERLAQRVQHMQFHQPLLGKPLGESGQGGGTGHGGNFSSMIARTGTSATNHGPIRLRMGWRPASHA